MDENFASDFDPLCIIDCDKKPGGGGVNSFDNIPISDRRYWLLTVIAGLFKESDFPILEDKLAKLYRIAFLRQQAKHLGIGNGGDAKNETKIDDKPSNISHFFNESPGREKRDSELLIDPTKPLNLSSIRTRNIFMNRNVYESINRQRKRIHKRSATPAKFSNKDFEIVFKNDKSNNSEKYRQNPIQKVSVVIHNITALTGEDREALLENKLDEDARNITNQTEILYSVLVNSKPILATIASQDIGEFESSVFTIKSYLHI